MSPYKPAHWSLAFKNIVASTLASGGILFVLLAWIFFVFFIITAVPSFSPIVTFLKESGSEGIAPYFMGIYLFLCLIASTFITYIFFKNVKTRRAAIIPISVFVILIGIFLDLGRLLNGEILYVIIDVGLFLGAHLVGIIIAQMLENASTR